MLLIDPHFLAIFSATNAACELLDALPDSDLVDELKELIFTQYELLAHLMENKHYGSDRLTEFMSYTSDILSQAERLKGIGK